MAQKFTIHKVTASFDYNASGVNDGVYFEKVTTTGDSANWFYLKVTDLAPTIDVKNLAIYSQPGNETTNHEVSGIYFSDLTTGWNTSTMKGQLVGRFDDGPYDGSAGLGRSMVMSDDFVISWNGTIGAYVIDVAGVGTGITSFIAQSNETNSLLQVASSDDGNGTTAGFGGSATIDATNFYLDVRIAPMEFRTAILGDRDTNAADDIPTERNIQAGSVKSTITAAEGSDILFDAYTYSEGAVNSYIAVIATDSRATGVGQFGKQFFLDSDYFATSTQTPGGAATADIITINTATIMTALNIDADSGGPSSVSPNDTLEIVTDASTTDVFSTFATTALNTETITILADRPIDEEDRIVFWDDTASKLTYLEVGAGLSLSGTMLTATGAFVNFDISADSGTDQTITSGNTLNIVTGASTTSVLSTVVGATDTISVTAVNPGADRIVFWDDDLAGGGLNYLSIGIGLSLSGTTLSSSVAAPNNGDLDMAVATGATGSTVTWDVGTGYSANTASDLIYTLDVGPALTNLATAMTSGTTGLLKKTGQDTYTFDTSSYMISWTLTADSGTNQTVNQGETVDIAGGDAITTEVKATNQVDIHLNYNSNDFELVGDVLGLKDKYVTDWKESVRVAEPEVSGLGAGYAYDDVGGTSSRGQITFSTGPTVIDGVTLQNGDRILNTENVAASGIWIRTEQNTWDRAPDFDSDIEVTSGATCSVEEGTKYKDRVYQLITNDPIQIGGAGGTVLLWTAVAKTAFFGVGTGLVLDASTNEVTFATSNSGTTGVTANNAYDGIMYRTNRIEVAVDNSTTQISAADQVEACWATADW